MIIHNITIRNFKSCYGEHKFNFDNLKGLIKLSGPIGSGKTTVCEAMLWGLFGTVKNQNNRQLISWNTHDCEIELNLTSKNKDIHIIRNIYKPLIVEVDGKTLAGSSKRNTQEILEEELYDVPKLAIVKMCLISFNQFNSLASMNPAETKQFLDDIFGFKIFTDYNNEIINEKRNQENELIKLGSIKEETEKHIDNLKVKQKAQTAELTESLNISSLEERKKELISKGKELKQMETEKSKEYASIKSKFNNDINDVASKISEVTALGKQAKKHYNMFKSGICPTCSQPIDNSTINIYKTQIDSYLDLYNKYNEEKQRLEAEKGKQLDAVQAVVDECKTQILKIKDDINLINTDIRSYNDSLKVIKSNYEELITEGERKLEEISKRISTCEHEVSEWSEMNELFTKTLRHKLLESLIPHINNSIQFFINKLDQSYTIRYDQEFKPHIFVSDWENEISYNNLSTGQRKSLDICIIFGILQNMISNIDFNVFVLDELFSNLDSNSRNTMLSLLNETMDKDKSIFIINHAEMNDDYFKHKIRVRLESKKIKSLKKNMPDNIAKISAYEFVF